MFLQYKPWDSFYILLIFCAPLKQMFLSVVFGAQILWMVEIKIP